MNKISKKERALGGLWGSVVGDALGVPVEFKDRATVQADPVTGMRGYGTHQQPPGTWSDDSSLLLCSADSLIQHEFDTEDMGKRFLAWYHEKLWTPWGHVFDIGMATSEALGRIASGVRAEAAGGDSEHSNGNGSLMRILPVALRFANTPTPTLIDHIHRASAITHRHPRSQMACGFLALVVRRLLESAQPEAAFSQACSEFHTLYEVEPRWAVELDPFQCLLAGDLSKHPESEIPSGGYALDTLVASLWCLLTTHSFQECVLKAVNLGKDTDTTGCVAGGLAGVAYGIESIPSDWISQLARMEDLDRLFVQFAGLAECSQESQSKG